MPVKIETMALFTFSLLYYELKHSASFIYRIVPRAEVQFFRFKIATNHKQI